MKDISRLEAQLLNHVNDNKIISILEKAADKIKNDIQNLAPVDTGEYRNSIKCSEVIKNNNLYKIEIFSDLNSGWKGIALGYLLEWGTGIKGENTNSYSHGYPYRTTPWVYYNERYGRWVFTTGNIARPHFYPGLNLNKDYFEKLILKEICK